LHIIIVYTSLMDVAVAELRAHLSAWLDRVGAGEEIVVTDRGMPIARVVGLDSRSLLERLTKRGVIAKPGRPHRPQAAGRSRPRPTRPVADHVSEQRR
jgi:prevent-host-death family protein